jgi:hypothetical protein
MCQLPKLRPNGWHIASHSAPSQNKVAEMLSQPMVEVGAKPQPLDEFGMAQRDVQKCAGSSRFVRWEPLNGIVCHCLLCCS